MSEWPLLVVVGPTASGKTALALRLAETLGPASEPTRQPAGSLQGEIVSCDSVSVYRGLEIGSAKPNAAERARVPHHCLDLYDPDEPCTAGDWARAARRAIEAIRLRGRVPIVAGGTGLYLRALLEGLAPAPARNERLRERLRRRAEQRGPTWLHRVLRRLDPRAAAAIHPNDVPKVIRSLEVTLAAGQPQTTQWAAGRAGLTGYRVLQMGVGGEREELYARIDGRAAAMFTRGLVQETAGLRARYGEDCRPLGSLGYAQAMAELRGECTRAQAIAAAQQGHRHYAKRQGTWFRRETALRWLPGFGDEAAVQEQALAWARCFIDREEIAGHGDPTE